MLEKINYKKLLSRTNVIIAIFGILPAAGYVIGISYYQGRLSAYGVSSDTFPLALQDIYVEAFWAVGLWLLTFAAEIAGIINKVFTLQGLCWALGSLLVVTLVFYLPIKHKSRIGQLMREKLQPIKKLINYLDSEKNAFTKAAAITGGFSYSALTVLMVVMLIALCWVGIPLMAYQKGRDDSNKTINYYLEKGCYIKKSERWSNCKRLITSDGKQIYEGILVAHTNGYVAFFDNTGSYVAKFPENAVIVSALPK
jgi:hypothetical protein